MHSPFAGRIVPPCSCRLSLAALIAALTVCTAGAQIPRTLSFQGVLTDSAGKPKANGSYNVTFRLFDALTGGSLLWTENAKPVVVSGGKGLFSTSLGAPTPFGGLAFDKPYFLQVQVAGEAAPMTPRLALPSAPYALNAWNTGGNSGTNPATAFLGTTDDRPLMLKANGRRVAQFQEVVSSFGARSVNVLAGSELNVMGPTVIGSTIGGGGRLNSDNTRSINDIQGNFSVIGGGEGNFVDADSWMVIGGGRGNIAQGLASTIGGGDGNNAQGQLSTIAGGSQNGASATAATVAGGSGNVAQGPSAFIGGGSTNYATGSHSVVAGGEGHNAYGSHAVIGGGTRNRAADSGVVAGGYENQALGLRSFIGSGYTCLLYTSRCV